MFNDSYCQVMPGKHNILRSLQYYALHGTSNNDIISQLPTAIKTKGLLTINNFCNDCKQVVHNANLIY